MDTNHPSQRSMFRRNITSILLTGSIGAWIDAEAWFGAYLVAGKIEEFVHTLTLLGCDYRLPAEAVERAVRDHRHSAAYAGVRDMFRQAGGTAPGYAMASATVTADIRHLIDQVSTASCVFAANFSMREPHRPPAARNPDNLELGLGGDDVEDEGTLGPPPPAEPAEDEEKKGKKRRRKPPAKPRTRASRSKPPDPVPEVPAPLPMTPEEGEVQSETYE